MGNKIGRTSQDDNDENRNYFKKRRAQSISWSFRYSSLRKKTSSSVSVATKQSEMIISQPHLDISKWLEILDLNQYEENFKNFSGVENLLELTESDIRKLGIRNSAHRARIVSNLVVIRDKHQKNLATASSLHNEGNNATTMNTIHSIPSKCPFQRHSVAVDTDSNSNLHHSTPHHHIIYQNHQHNQQEHNHSSKDTIDNSNSNCNSSSTNNNAQTNEKENPSIYEALNVADSKQSNSCGDLLLNMDPTSNEAQEAIALKKALEWELSLDSRDLRSHAWYHGGIPRQRSEEIVQKEGDFLIRDCASQPGNYVLTCRTKTSVLHFVINKILIQPETVYERVQYQFEDDAYDTVPDLITFYVGSGKPISVASGAKIQFPCNRTYPLSYYGSNKFMGNNQFHHLHHHHNAAAHQHGGVRGGNGSYRSPMSSPPRTKRDTPPRLPSKKQRSQSLTPIQPAITTNSTQNVDKYCSADGMIQNTNHQITDGTTSLPGHLNEAKKLITSTEKCNSADGVIQQNYQLQNGSVKDIMIRSADEKSTSADGIINHHNNTSATTVQMMSRSTGDSTTNLKFSNSHSTISRAMSGNLRLSSSRASSLNRDASESSLSPCIEQNNFMENDEKPPSPPPKPSRTPATVTSRSHSREKYTKDSSNHIEQHHPLNRVASYHASGSDSGNGSGDSIQSSATGDSIDPTLHRGVIIKNPRFMTNSASSMTLKSFSDFDVLAAEQELASMQIPIIEQITKFDLENFHTLLLPAVENKPLDNSALNTIRMMLAETGPRIIAQHLTRIDINLILDDIEQSDESENSILNCCGLELITLPHGQLFRQDLIERTQCLKLLVAVTILTCQSDLERAETLNKWIQVAVDTKTALGNLFGFCAIMLGLCMPQIQKLEPTWHILRQKFTDSAFTFEAKLRPTLKSMNDSTNPQAPNTTVPHLLPYIILKDRGIEEILMTIINQQQQQQQQQQTSSLISCCISPWEINADDFGITTLFQHLDSARCFTKNLSLYRKNAKIVIEDSNSRLDELLSDAFRTEFHIKFLWGSKGATASAEDRHLKLEQVLALMAEKFCGGDQFGNAG